MLSYTKSAPQRNVLFQRGVEELDWHAQRPDLNPIRPLEDEPGHPTHPCNNQTIQW